MNQTSSLYPILANAARRLIIQMISHAQSGHPGGSLSSIDYLTVLYAHIIGHSGYPLVVSNGHISPAVYSILALCGYIPEEEILEGFRSSKSIYEGHVSREVPGVWYGTGPLGIGGSVACGFALDKKSPVFTILGDGECNEGQIHEMALFASQHRLSNLVLFIDQNHLQLSGSTDTILPMDLQALFEAYGWSVHPVSGHDHAAIEQLLDHIIANPGEKPHIIIGETIMGKGVSFMEKEAISLRSTWHGKAPGPELAVRALEELGEITAEEQAILKQFKTNLSWKPNTPLFEETLAPIVLNTGTPNITTAPSDCRSSYGKALLDLAQLNPSVIALTADLRDSVKTSLVAEQLPQQHIECGIAEQHMMSMAGGLSLDGKIPFVSTFAAFATSRAKDQVRVNDINRVNIKIVATHAGLSVGEDGPTHQAIDDMGSMMGLPHMMILEPADANQTDHLTRYIASHYGHFYMRMGRHAFPIITKEDGTPYFDEHYMYTYGQCDLIRQGIDITIIAIGASVSEALQAIETLQQNGSKISYELIAVSSPKCFDEKVLTSVRKTKHVLTIEDHNPICGLGAQVSSMLFDHGISVEAIQHIGVDSYQRSGTWKELYTAVGIEKNALINTLEHFPFTK